MCYLFVRDFAVVLSVCVIELGSGMSLALSLIFAYKSIFVTINTTYEIVK